MSSQPSPEFLTENVTEPFTLQERVIEGWDEVGRHALTLEGFHPMPEAQSQSDEIRQALEARIIDQPAAIQAITEAIDRVSVRSESDNRPIATLAFLGPTGVGKSECAKVLAELTGEGYPNLIKIDCSAFAHGHEVASLIGSPKGYKGSDEEPRLTEDNVEQPGTVILFDEIEKGSPELYNLMLQIMGDGELRLLHDGSLVSFRDAIIIMTSNLGATEMASKLSPVQLGFNAAKGVVDSEGLNKLAVSSFDNFFKPEFVNRLTKKIVFHPLTSNGLQRVLETKLSRMNEEYADRFGARLSFSEAAMDHIVGVASLEAHNGARPLVRELEKIETEFGRHLSGNAVPEGTHVRIFHETDIPEEHVDKFPGTLVFTSRPERGLRKKVVAIEPFVPIEDPFPKELEAAPPPDEEV